MLTQTSEILKEIIDRSGRRRGDGQALYTYRISLQDLGLLRESLASDFADNPRRNEAVICGAFCLFAAEWFRRNHEDGPWKWELIFQDGLRLPSHVLREVNTNVTRSRLVDTGFRYWNLSKVETEGSVRYLASLACQGGLPLKTLRKENSRLKRFFEACLEYHERWPTEPAETAIKLNAASLPVTLQNVEVQILAEVLISAVAKLRRLSRDASQSAEARVTLLDTRYPRWRDELPLRLDDDDREQAELLMGLLHRSPVRRGTDEFPSVETRLTLTSASATISRLMAAGNSISEESLTRFLQLNDKRSLQPRMTFWLVSAIGRKPVARVTQRSGKAEFTIAVSPASLDGVAAVGDVLLETQFGSELIAKVQIVGGQELGDSPWIFAPNGEKPGTYRLLGIGSLRTRETSVVVAIPGNVLTSEGQSNCRLLPQTVAGRCLLEVSGSLELSYEDNTYRIRTRASEEGVALFWLNGRQVTCGMGGSVVWAGLPRILEVTPEKSVTEVPSREIQWRYEGAGRVWQSGLIETRGRLRVRVIRDGVTLFQRTIDVVPRDFSVRIIPTNTLSGRISLRYSENDVAVSVADDPRIRTQVSERSDECSVTCQVLNETRPLFINLKLQFSNRGEVEIQVPCPTAWVGLMDAGGTTFPEGRSMPWSSLKQFYLRVISPRNQVPQLFCERSERSTFLADLKVSDQTDVATFELPLSVVSSRISSMMSTTSDIDETVQLEVMQGSLPEPLFRFQVSRYSGCLEKDQSALGDDGDSMITDVFLPDGLPELLKLGENQISVELTHVAWPDRPMEADVLKKIGPFRWRVFREKLQPGPYLITPWLDDFSSLRPLRISVKGNPQISSFPEVVQGSVDEFEQVCRIWDRESRRRAWRGVIEVLALRFDAAAWGRIDAMLLASEYRPMTTFEAIIALSQNPLAMARIGICHAGRQWVWDRMEELPFMWCLVPVRTWVRAAFLARELQRRRLQSAGMEPSSIDELLREHLRGFLVGAVGRPAVLAAAAACIPFADPSIPQDSNLEWLMPKLAKRHLEEREQERSRLIAEHSGDNACDLWPQARIEFNAVTPVDWRDLLFDDCIDHQRAVLNGPLIAAAHSVFGVSVDEQQLSVLKELRGFDTGWFDRCFELMSFVLAGRRFSKDEKWILKDSI